MTTTINGLTGVSQIQNGTVTADDLATVTVGNAGPQRMQLFAAKATTSGTSIDFSPTDSTGIPSWAKRVTIMLASVSTSGSSNVVLRVGAGSIDATGYSGMVSTFTSASVASIVFTSDFILAGANATSVISGSVVLEKQSGNTWIAKGGMTRTSETINHFIMGLKSLSDSLDSVRLTTSGGTDTFDAGSVSILVEG